MKKLKTILLFAVVTFSINAISQPNYIIQANDSKVFWEQFEKEFTRLINSSNITEFKGDNETNSWGQTYFDCKLKPLGVNKKEEFIYKEPEDFIPYTSVSLNMGDLREFRGAKRTPDQMKEVIYKIEAIFDEITKSKFVKVYCADESVNIMAGEPYLASKFRITIDDNIYYIKSEEVNLNLSELQQPYVKVDIETTSYGALKVSISFRQ